MPAAGGQAEKLEDCRPNASVTLSWHPNGMWLAFSDTEAQIGGHLLFAHHLASGTRFKLTQADPKSHRSGDILPVFSPSGRQIVFARGKLGAHALLLMNFDPERVEYYSEYVARETPIELVSSRDSIKGLCWSPDGRSLVFSRSVPGSSRLWRLWIEGARSEPILVPSLQSVNPSMSNREDLLIFEEEWIEQNIWAYRVPKGISGTNQLQPLIQSSRWDGTPQFDASGRYIAFASTRSGSMQLWVCETDGNQPRMLTRMISGYNLMPSWSPKGDFIAFMAMIDGQFEIYRVSVNGGLTLRLTENEWTDGMPHYSPDGRWLYFSSDRDGTMRTWRMPSHGGSANLVTTTDAAVAKVSQDGTALFYSRMTYAGIWRQDLPNGTPEQISGELAPGDWNNWALTPSGIYWLDRSNQGQPRIRFYDHQSRQMRNVHHSDSLIVPEVAGLAVHEGQNHTQLLLTRVDRVESDILVVSPFH